MFVIENVRLIPNASVGKLYEIENEVFWSDCHDISTENLNILECESVLIDKLSSTALFSSQNKGIKMIHFLNNEDITVLVEFLDKLEIFASIVNSSYIEYKKRFDTQKNKRLDDLDEATLNLLEAFSKVPQMAKSLIKKLRGEPEELHRPRGIKSQGIPINPWIFDRQLELPVCRMKFDIEIVEGCLPENVRARLIYNSAGKILNSKNRKYFWLSVLRDEEGVNNENTFIDQESVTRIEKDINRLGERDNVIILRLEKILRDYCLIDYELGYVQGMADLALPFAQLFESQSDASKCFNALMKRVKSNFSDKTENEDGMEGQLRKLRDLIEELSPLLSDYLKFNRDSDNLFFAYRWLLVLFRREFEGIERLWDVMFAAESCGIVKIEEFRIYVALAMILSQKDRFVKTCSRFEDLLKVPIM